MIRISMFRVKNSMLFTCCIVGLTWIVCARFFNAGTSDAFYSEQSYQEDLSRVYLDLVRFSQQRGDLKKAGRFFKHAIKLNPYYLETYCALGSLYELQKKDKKSFKLYLKTLHSQAKNSIFFEENPKTKIPNNFNSIPKWNGEDIKDKIIFVYSNSSTDTESISIAIRFSRFIPLLVKQKYAKKIYFSPPNALTTLLARVDLCAEIIDDISSIQESIIDYCVPLESVPYLVGCDTEEHLCPSKYINIENERIEIMNSDFIKNKKSGYSIGLFFPFHNTLLSSKIIEILKLKNIKTNFYDLSYNDNDLESLTSIISNLDVIIGIHSIQTELAGALGKKVLVINNNKKTSSWFEKNHFKESLWYPTTIELNCKKNPDLDLLSKSIIKFLKKEIFS